MATVNVTATVPRPFANCYWVTPGRLLAGEYPSAFTVTAARRKVHRLLDAGVTFFLDLTHPDDPLEPYAQFLEETVGEDALPIVYRRLAIPDRTVPSAAQMTQTLDIIDAALAAGHVVYVHCWGGVGRTGTVVGCYLVRHKYSGGNGDENSGEAALAQLARLWQTVEKRDRFPQSPETPAQMEMVRRWKEADSGAQGAPRERIKRT